MKNDWIFSRPGNLLFVVIDGKAIELKNTVHQMNSYTAFLEKNSNKEADGAPMGFVKGLKKISLDALELAEIILNPIEGQLDYTQEKIQKLLDIDKLRIMGEEWVDRKVLRPKALREGDPLLALGEK
ncbi:MAG: hypothetical protein HQM10_26765 [Candidatus Riflebacteria bacterium]|nr:hypothetical protein [Candidatus Riflebacteria bacterium]